MRKSVLVTVLLAGVCFPTSSSAEVYASSDKMKVATGHYARARAMLVEALAEFDHAASMASPDMLLDSEEWRLSVISRTEELNRVLDPKPRVSRHGVRFNADRLNVEQVRNRPQRPTPDPYTASYVGEDELQARKKARKVKEIAERNLEEARQAKERQIEEEQVELSIPAVEIEPQQEENLVNSRPSLSEEPVPEEFLGQATEATELEQQIIDEKESEVLEESVEARSEQLEGEMEKTVESMLKERMLQLQQEKQIRGAQ